MPPTEIGEALKVPPEPLTVPSDQISASAETPTPLPVELMYRRADLSNLSFQTTDDLEPVVGIVGQKRAVDAIDFGTRIHQPGFNLFVIGSDDARMHGAVQSLLKARVATEKPELSDWVYVNNFADPRKPVAIRLPTGRAIQFHDAMHELIEDLKIALPAMFQSEDYQARHGAVNQAFQAKQQAAFSALHEKASAKSIAIVRTPMGFRLGPVAERQDRAAR